MKHKILTAYKEMLMIYFNMNINNYFYIYYNSNL